MLSFKMFQVMYSYLFIPREITKSKLLIKRIFYLNYWVGVNCHFSLLSLIRPAVDILNMTSQKLITLNLTLTKKRVLILGPGTLTVNYTLIRPKRCWIETLGLGLGFLG